MGMSACRLLFSAFCLLPAALVAQTFGEVTGTVTDPTGAVVTGAVITITNTATNQVRRASTNDAGNYTVPFLVPGIYDLQVEVPGFKLAARKGIELEVGAVARIDFTLAVGAVTEVVEVAGGASLLATESTSLGTVIENKRMVELPLNGRNYLQLVALTANVTHEMGAGGQADERQGGERANQPISIAGQRQQFNHFTLDGIENTDVSYNTFVIRPSIDALQEFKVQTGVYSAEYGREASQINATTKPGSNEFHGSVFEFLRNDKLDAREWRQEGDKNPFRRNQFGFTLGGRVIRDKVFFLSNFEALRDVKTLQGTANVATDRMRAGDLSGQTRTIYDPLTRVFMTDAQANESAVSATSFPNNIIPRNRFHAISQKLLEFYPRATVPGDNILRNFIRQSRRPINWEQFTQRVDFNERPSSNWFGRFSWGDEFVKRLASFEAQEGRTVTKVYQAMISNTRSFGAAIVNEFRFGYNQFQNDQLLHFGNIRDVTAEVGIVGVVSPDKSAWGTPAIGLENGLTGFGESGNGPFVNRNQTFQWLDNLSVVRGNHSLKFGGEIRRDRYNQIGNSFLRGVFNFQAKATFDPARRAATGHSFADFLLGESRISERSLGLAIIQFRSTPIYLYTEDTWKITPRLTMNIGLRYENTPPWHDKHRGIMNVQMFDPGVGPQGLLPPGQTRIPIFTRPGKGDFHEGLLFHFHDGIPTQAGDEFLGRSLVRRDNNDFAPRVGLAYSPTARYTFRSGFGVFYSQDTGNPKFDMARNLNARGRFDANEERPNSNLSAPWAFERQNFRCTGWTGFCQGPPAVLAANVNRRTPYLFQWLFDVQRQFGENMSLEVDYQGNAGHKLERWRNYNEPVYRMGPDDARSIPQRRPWPVYDVVFDVDGVVNSNYNALSTRLQRRFSKGLTYLVGFTWSKSIDDASAIRPNSGDRQFPVWSYDMKAERGLSQFHTGRRLVTSILYEFPFGRGKTFGNRPGLLGKIIGGWQAGSILTFSDGTPVNVGSIGDSGNIAESNYPDATGVSPIPRNRSEDNFWNIAAFDTTSRALAFRSGNAGRNVLLTPGLRQWDFSLLKNTTIRESQALQFRFEAFNFSNHPNWETPRGDARSPATFGRIISARTMRELQFGLKYVF